MSDTMTDIRGNDVEPILEQDSGPAMTYQLKVFAKTPISRGVEAFDRLCEIFQSTMHPRDYEDLMHVLSSSMEVKIRNGSDRETCAKTTLVNDLGDELNFCMCGCLLEPGAKFCRNCGVAIEN